MINIFIPGQPERVTEQQHRFGGYGKNGKAIIYRDLRLESARYDMIQKLIPYIPHEPIEGPVSLKVIWKFGTKDKKKVRECWKTTRPDTDNLVKGLKDCLTECGFWKDDAQVCEECLAKCWVPMDLAGIRIFIKEMNSDERTAEG